MSSFYPLSLLMLRPTQAYIGYLHRSCSSSVNIKTTVSNPFDYSTLCSSASRQRCIRRFQEMPQIKLATRPLLKSAAVLIPMCRDRNGKISLLFTLRSSRLAKHRREVSFPGGLLDANDSSLESCALRETEEEIGFPRQLVSVWGSGRLILPKLEPAIMPVVGYLRDFDIDKLILNADEVDCVFTVPLERLCSPEMHRHTQFRSGYIVPVYLGAEERIWGITAAITHAFLCALLPNNVYHRKMKMLPRYRATAKTQ